MIKTEKLSYEYATTAELPDGSSKLRALQNINLSIKEGQFVSILGHNGSGKSTLAKMLNGILLPSHGDVIVFGKNTKIDEDLLEIRKKCSMVFQNPDNQIIGSVVEEDVAFGLENLNVPSEEIVLRVEDSLKKVDMIDYKNSSPNKLSGGQKQRIAIASVLAMQPKCIVFDEPTAMLDPKGRREVIDTLYRLNKEDNVTIILITHFMEEVLNSDRLIIMNNGEIAIDMSPKEAFKNYDKLIELGLELPEITKLSIDLIDSGINIPVAFSEDELVSSLIEYKLNMNRTT